MLQVVKMKIKHFKKGLGVSIRNICKEREVLVVVLEKSVNSLNYEQYALLRRSVESWVINSAMLRVLATVVFMPSLPVGTSTSW